MRRRYRQINGELVEIGNDYHTPTGPSVIPDIQPYRSQIDGSVITSRSKHRAHLRQHGCIEVGNEKMKNREYSHPDGLKEKIIRAVEQNRRK